MSAPLRQWFTLQELAGLNLRGMPSSRQGWNRIAEREGWADRTGGDGQPLARQRSSRGGGTEYHASILPPPVRAALVRLGALVEVDEAPETLDIEAQDAWTRFGRQTAKVKAQAEYRATVLRHVEEAEELGTRRSTAVILAATFHEISARTVWKWLEEVTWHPREDRVPALAKPRTGGRRRTDIPAALWSFYESWWLRQSKPTHADTYRRTAEEARRLGITILPSAKTFQRRAEQIPPEIVALKRGGPEATRKLVPAIERSVADMHALEMVNADGHKWDFRVRFPDGTEGRPITIALQDIYSRKFLAWRHGKAETATLVRLAFVDLFRNWGFPKSVLLDNGRAFASKWITGGAKNRYRYSIKSDDPLGILPRFDLKVHWALPYRGSSKPIERGFRDFAQTIARHPAFDGAYVGNNVAAKPENYGSRVIEWEEFVRVVDAEIALHNGREGRRTEMADGKSFDAVFAESYRNVPISRATEAQLRECLLSAEKVRSDRETGAIRFMGNRYWTPGMASIAGRPLTIYYDPEDLHTAIHVHDERGAFLLTAPIWEKSGFLTEDHGRARMKIERDLVKNARKEADLRDLLSAQELSHRALIAASEEESPPPSPTVIRPVRPVRTRGGAAVAVDQFAPASSEVLDKMTAAFRRERLRLVDDDE